MSEPVFEALSLIKVIPVVEIVDPSTAVELAETLMAAGLPTMEITLRTDGALTAITLIHQAYPDFLIGAGTLVTASQVAEAVSAGARFGVSPGYSLEVSAAAEQLDFPLIPGAVTVTEVLAARSRGHRFLKFFPAEQSGGAAVIQSMVSPLAALDVKFMPTGGVKPNNLANYLQLLNVFAVGGTWIAPRDQIAARDFAAISDSARAVVELLAEITVP